MGQRVWDKRRNNQIHSFLAIRSLCDHSAVYPPRGRTTRSSSHPDPWSPAISGSKCACVTMHAADKASQSQKVHCNLLQCPWNNQGAKEPKYKLNIKHLEKRD